MVEFINFIMTRKLGLVLVTLSALIISYFINLNQKVDYYYDIGIYIDPIFVFNDKGIATEDVHTYESIFKSKAFYTEHNRTRMHGSYPKISRKDGDTIRITVNEYDNSYTYGNALMKKIYNDSLDRIKYYYDAGSIFKMQSEKYKYTQIQSSSYDNSEIFIYHFSPIYSSSIKGSTLSLLFILLGLSIYISFLLIEFSRKAEK